MRSTARSAPWCGCPRPRVLDMDHEYVASGLVPEAVLQLPRRARAARTCGPDGSGRPVRRRPGVAPLRLKRARSSGSCSALSAMVLVWLVFAYNRLIRLRNEAEQGYSSIDIQLKRRADLIPNLVETVKAYAAHERGGVRGRDRGAVDDAGRRQSSARPRAPSGRCAARWAGCSRWPRRTPQLRASENFRAAAGGALRHRGQDRRRAAVLQQRRPAVQHGSSRRCPTSLMAGALGFRPREFFELEDEGDRAPVAVDSRAVTLQEQIRANRLRTGGRAARLRGADPGVRRDHRRRLRPRAGRRARHLRDRLRR